MPQGTATNTYWQYKKNKMKYHHICVLHQFLPMQKKKPNNKKTKREWVNTSSIFTRAIGLQRVGDVSTFGAQHSGKV